MANQLAAEPTMEERLRLEAGSRLKDGNAPDARDWTISPDALSLLYRLASDPNSAADALKLLHEMQTYQVELDLQHEQVMANEHELAQDLNHYRTLFELAPIGYLVVDFGGRIAEINRPGAALLGLDASDIAGQPLSSFLDVESRPALTEFLGALKESGATTVCHVRPGDREHTPRMWRLAANVAPGGQSALLVVSDAD